MIEIRHTSAAVALSRGSLTIREAVQNMTAGTLRGYAAVFYRRGDHGSEYELAAGVLERIAPSAFDQFLRGSGDAVVLWNHSPDFLLGRRSSGTLKLSVDAIGLRYDLDTPDTQLGNDLTTLVARGDIVGSSFSFVAEETDWRDENGTAIRLITRATLFDVSLVTNPAYGSTSVSAGLI